MKTIERMLKAKNTFGPDKQLGPQAQQDSLDRKPGGPANPTGTEAPASSARQGAHDKVVEGLTVLAHDFPAAEDLLTQFEKQFQTWSGAGDSLQSPKQGPPEGVGIPTAKDLPSAGEYDQAPQPQPDQKPDRGGPPGEQGKPFWKRGR